MRMKHLVLATVAALATVLPARADLSLVFKTANVTPAANSPLRNDYQNFPSTGTGNRVSDIPTVGGVPTLTMAAGSTKIVVVYMALDSATNVGANEAFWAANTGTFSLKSFGMNVGFNPSLVDNPNFVPNPPVTLDENLPNLAGQGVFSLSYPNQPYPANYRQILGITTGGANYSAYDLNDSGPGALFAMRVVAGSTPTAGTTITFSRYTAGAGGAPVDNFELSNNVAGQSRYLDNEVFGGPHPTFGLNVVVTGVPEPSSMVLAGVAFAGFGWRKLRRKKA